MVGYGQRKGYIFQIIMGLIDKFIANVLTGTINRRLGNQLLFRRSVKNEKRIFCFLGLMVMLIFNITP